MPAPEALFRRALQQLWPTAGGQLTSAEMYVHFLVVGVTVSTAALHAAWRDLRERPDPGLGVAYRGVRGDVGRSITAYG
jgi:hypothetical protein